MKGYKVTALPLSSICYQSGKIISLMYDVHWLIFCKRVYERTKQIIKKCLFAFWRNDPVRSELDGDLGYLETRTRTIEPCISISIHGAVMIGLFYCEKPWVFRLETLRLIHSIIWIETPDLQSFRKRVQAIKLRHN